MVVNSFTRVHGYLAHKKTPTPLGPPQDPRHGPTVESYGVAVSYKRGTPAFTCVVVNICTRVGCPTPDLAVRGQETGLMVQCSKIGDSTVGLRGQGVGVRVPDPQTHTLPPEPCTAEEQGV